MRTSDVLADDGLAALAATMIDRAGFQRPRSLARLAGGRNNQVFRIDTAAGAPLVLKRYFSDPRDPRDRLTAEWDFLARAWSDGVRAIPQPLAKDGSAQAALYSFVPGRRLETGELEPAHIDAAADFILAINARRHASLAPASDACFSISDHLNLVERRLLRLAALDPQAPCVADAERFVFATLRPMWETVRESAARKVHALSLDPYLELSESECWLSPSDFGFHNALGGDENPLVFLDFEYAGRDDPTKLVMDFLCQPQVPVPFHYRDRFLARLGLDDHVLARCNTLLDTCRVKWACILLNDFLPVGEARRAFAETNDRQARCAAQLEKAKAMLSEIRL